MMEIKTLLQQELGTEPWFGTLIDEISPDMEVRWFLKAGVSEAESDTIEGLNCGLTRFKMILTAWKYDVDHGVPMVDSDDAHKSASIMQTLRTCFFSQGWAFRLFATLKIKGMVDSGTEQLAAAMAKDILNYGERGANNRSFFYGMAHAYACQSFPYLPESQDWKEYAEAVFQDWYEGGGCYEPGYVAHNIAWIIQLGHLLGKDKELKSERACNIYKRYLDHISPSGLVIAPGDGDDQSSYLEALLCMKEVTGDSAYDWAIEKVKAAGEYGGYRGKTEKREVSEKYASFDEIAPEGNCTQIQYLSPHNQETKDRIILNPSRKTGNPYMGMMINDRYDTLHHESEDNRGEIYHYESDGVLYLKRSSWYKWAEQTNTLVLEDAVSEFPFVYSEGLIRDHWYRGDANLRLMEHFIPDDRYEICLEAFDTYKHFEKARKINRSYDMPLPLQYRDRESPKGIFLSNPRGLTGENEEIHIESVTLSVHTFPKKYWEGEKNFEAAMTWNRDEHRNLVYSDGPVTMEIKNLFMAGPAGKVYFHYKYDLEQCLCVVQYSEGSSARVLEGEDLNSVLTVRYEDGNPVFILHCEFGRIDLLFEGLHESINTTIQYTRIGFDYCYRSDVSNYLRTPVKILVNRITTRSLHADHQQGGVLKSAVVNQKGNDCYGEVSYEGVYTYDTDWSRKTLLTEEGYLFVVDEIMPGEDSAGLAGGPVWQLPNPPVMGLHWADAAVEKDLGKSLLVYFHPARGSRYGIQCQPKLWVDREYAFYDRTRLYPGKKQTFVTVLIPHDSSLSPLEICNKKNEGGLLEPSKKLNSLGVTMENEYDRGILTDVSEEGDVSIKINTETGLQNMAVFIRDDGTWDIIRK